MILDLPVVEIRTCGGSVDGRHEGQWQMGEAPAGGKHSKWAHPDGRPEPGSRVGEVTPQDHPEPTHDGRYHAERGPSGQIRRCLLRASRNVAWFGGYCRGHSAGRAERLRRPDQSHNPVGD